MSVHTTVLIADDDATVTPIVSKVLRPYYNIVGIATDGEDALNQILEAQPDFAVLDITLPHMDGLTIAKRLRADDSRTKVVFLTLIDDEDYVELARSLGHGYVLKRRLSLDLLPALTAAQDGDFFISH